MLYLILCVIVAVIAYICEMVFNYGDVFESICTGLIAAILSVLVSLFSICLTNAIASHYGEYDYIDQSYSMNIAALKDSSSEYGDLHGNGAFFLGCGTMKIEGHSGSKMVYTYFKETPSGVIMCQTDCDKAYVKTTTGRPKIEVEAGYYKYTSSDFNKKWLLIFDNVKDGEYKTTFYVPEGSICNDYEIDME